MEKLRVRFDARPPAELVAGDVTIPAGGEDELPADLARELAANPHVEVTILDAAPADEKAADTKEKQ